MHHHFQGSILFAENMLSESDGGGGIDGVAQTCPINIGSAVERVSRGGQLVTFTSQMVCSMADRMEAELNTLSVFSKSFVNPHTEALEAEKKQLAQLKSRRQDADAASSTLKANANHLEYLALEDECFSTVDSHFTYTVCVMKDVTQKDNDNSGGGSVVLGSYRHIKDKATATAGTSSGGGVEGGGHVIKYKDGTHCHAFGARSAEVHVTCGVENKLLSAREPSTCSYLLEMISPAACSPQYAQENGLTV